MVTRESFGQLVLHFFYDITHFDSKFFDTLKYLITRPGFLSKEYMEGKRARYLNPIRMYVFTSAFFFLVFFSIRGTDNVVKLTGNEPLTLVQRDSTIQRLEAKQQQQSSDPQLNRILEHLRDTSRPIHPADLYAYAGDFVVVGTIGGKYASSEQYDSIQANSPRSERDWWLVRLWNKRALSLNEKYRYQPDVALEKISDTILHKLPYILFVSLPFFAWILSLLYIRRKKFYFADHGIFSVHHYILCFILLLFVFLWEALGDLTGWGIWTFFTLITALGIPIYLYKAMRRFYGQRRGKTILKFLLLNIIGFAMLVFVLALFFLFSLFQL